MNFNQHSSWRPNQKASRSSFISQNQNNFPPRYPQEQYQQQARMFSVQFGNQPYGAPSRERAVFQPHRYPTPHNPWYGGQHPFPYTRGEFRPPLRQPNPPMRTSMFFPPTPAGAMYRFSPTNTVPVGQTEPLQTPAGSYESLKEEYKEAMKHVVNKWLQGRGHNEENEKKKSLLKIHDYQETMRQYIVKLEELRNLNDCLVENLESEEEKWNSFLQNAQFVKSQVCSLQTVLFNEEQKDFITKQINLRKKKRNRSKVKKKLAAERYIASLSNRIKLNESIDEWQQKEQTKLLMERLEDNLKNEAGESLVEVKRKQTEAKEFIDLFSNLNQLRDIRKETAIYKGIMVTENDDEAFNEKVQKIIRLWNNQKKIYESEERALRVLREEEAEELNRAEKERRKKRKQTREKDLNTVDPMYAYRLYWLQAEENMNAFLRIRGLWDMYLCQTHHDGGSRMPSSWVDACAPSSKEWTQYLIKQKKL